MFRWLIGSLIFLSLVVSANAMQNRSNTDSETWVEVDYQLINPDVEINFIAPSLYEFRDFHKDRDISKIDWNKGYKGYTSLYRILYDKPSNFFWQRENPHITSLGVGIKSPIFVALPGEQAEERVKKTVNSIDWQCRRYRDLIEGKSNIRWVCEIPFLEEYTLVFYYKIQPWVKLKQEYIDSRVQMFWDILGTVTIKTER